MKKKEIEMENDIILPYTWDIEDDTEECTIIRIYGIDNNNESICIKISDFTPYVYLELPGNIDGMKLEQQCFQIKSMIYVDNVSQLKNH